MRDKLQAPVALAPEKSTRYPLIWGWVAHRISGFCGKEKTIPSLTLPVVHARSLVTIQTELSWLLQNTLYEEKQMSEDVFGKD